VRFYTGAEAVLAARWVAGRIPNCSRGWDRCVTLLIGDPVQAGVVYHDWNPAQRTICMSAASESKRWLTRPVLHRMHEYVFDDADCRMAILQVSENNTAMRRIAKAYGYRETLVPDLRADGEAEAVLTLHERDWRDSRFHIKRQTKSCGYTLATKSSHTPDCSCWPARASKSGSFQPSP